MRHAQLAHCIDACAWKKGAPPVQGCFVCARSLVRVLAPSPLLVALCLSHGITHTECTTPGGRFRVAFKLQIIALSSEIPRTQLPGAVQVMRLKYVSEANTVTVCAAFDWTAGAPWRHIPVGWGVTIVEFC